MKSVCSECGNDPAYRAGCTVCNGSGWVGFPTGEARPRPAEVGSQARATRSTRDEAIRHAVRARDAAKRLLAASELQEDREAASDAWAYLREAVTRLSDVVGECEAAE